MDEKKSVIEGWRKLGLGMGAITALTIKDNIDFKTAVIVGIIAIVGIVCQGYLDSKKTGAIT